MAGVTQQSSLPEGLLVKTEEKGFKVFHGGQLSDLQGVPKTSPASSAVGPKLPSAPLGPQKPVATGATAAHFLFPEDEEEIRQHAERVKGVAPTPFADFDRAVASLRQQFAIPTGDDVIANRFRRIVEARLRNIRDDLETEEILTRSTKVGGMGLSPDIAERIVEALAPEAERIHAAKPPEPPRKKLERQMPPLPTPKTPVFRPTLPPLPVQPKTAPSVIPSARAPQPELPKPSIPHPAPMKPPTWAAPVAQRPPTAALPPPPRVQPAAPAVRLPQPPQPAAPEVMPKVQRPAMADDRPVVSDIRRPSRLTGPVEELRQMSLEDFRRLAPTPSEAVKRVKEKISTLAEESFGKAVEGITAWRSNEVYRQYLDLGRRSMETGKSVAESIASLSVGPGTLTKEEFFAVLQLNQELRF